MDACKQEQPGGVGRLIALNAAALTIGRLLNAVIGLFSVGITSRYLGVDVYGTLITVTVFTILFIGLSDLGVSTIGAREIAKRPDEMRRLMSSLCTIALGLSLFATAIGLGVGYLIFSGPGDGLEREGITLLILISLPLASATAPAGAYLIAMQRAYIAALASLAASVAMTLILVLAVTLDLGFTAVLIANAAQAIVGAVLILGYTLARVRFRPTWDVALCKQLLRWTIPLSAVYVLGLLYWRIDIILLALMGSRQEVGVYGLAFKVVDTFYTLPLLVMVTLLPEFARSAHDPARRAELVQKASTVVQIAIVPLLVFTIAFAREITTIAGGEAFDDSSVVLQILMLGVAAGSFRAVLTQALIALNRQVWLMCATGALLVANVALNLALIPVLGARGAAVAFAATEAGTLVLVLALFRRIGAVRRPRRMPQVLLAGGAMGAVTLMQMVPLADRAGPVAVVAVLGSLSTAVYIGCLYAFKAMPREVHSTLVAPLLTRLRAARRTG